MEIHIHPAFGVAIMMNNFFHNVATALLAASGIALWVILKKFDSNRNKEDKAVKEYFLDLYGGMTRLARISLFWILIGGVPRTLFYRDFEWVTAVKHGQVPALIVQHVLAFFFVGTGVYLWLRLRKRVREIEDSMGLGNSGPEAPPLASRN